jgi:hypothetical protein
MNSMWWNTLALRGAVTTPTKLDRFDSSCAAVRDDPLRLVGLQVRLDLRAVAPLARLRRQHRVDEER